MVKDIKQAIPHGFNGFYDSGLGAFKFFAEHGFNVDEILVYAGGMAPNNKISLLEWSRSRADAWSRHIRQHDASELLGKLDMKGNTLTWDPKNPTNPDYLVPRPPKPTLTEDEKILEEFDKAIDEMTDEEKELLFSNREYMNPLKFCDLFIANRPSSVYVDSFRKVRGHLKRMDSMSWRTPLDRDSVISRRVNTQYRLMRANSRKLKGNVPFYVIYGLMQKRDLYTGVKLSRPILEVGYYTSPSSMRYITSAHSMSLLKSLKQKSNVYFRIAYFKALKKEGVIPKKARFKDYFEAVPIDMAATKKQRDHLEVFYTIYLNRMNGRFSYGLDYNTFFNAIVGNLYDDKKTRTIVDDMRDVPVEPDYVTYISKEHLDSAIRLGLDKKDLMWYFREPMSTIIKIVNYYYPTKSWVNIRKDVITDYLEYLASEGVPHEALTNYFYECSQDYATIVGNYKSLHVDVIPYTVRKINGLIIRYLGSIKAYNDLLLEGYLKEHFFKMHSQGLISKEKLINVIKGVSRLPYIDSKISSGLSGIAFRWIFQLLYAPDIMRTLSSKDYGVYGVLLPIELIKDLGLYIEGDNNFNVIMQRRLELIIESMFFTTDLSQIYKFLNAGIL